MKISPNIGLNIPEGNDIFDHDKFLTKNLEKVDQYLMNATNVTENFNAVNAQLAQNMKNLDSRGINIKTPPPPLVGAKGDNVSDDYTTIQAIVNFCESNGFDFYIPNNSFRVSNAIITTINHINITCDGVIKPYGTYSDYLFKVIGQWQNPENNTIGGQTEQAKKDIKGLRLECEYKSRGLYIATLDHFSFQNIQIKNAYGNAFHMHGCREADVFGLTIQDTMNGVLDTVTTPRPEPAFELREPTGFAGAPNNCIRFHGLNIVYPSGTAVLVDCDGNAGRAWFIDFIGPQIHYLDSTLGNLVLDHNVELVKLLNCESIFFLGGSLRIANTSQGTLVAVGSATKQASAIRIGSNLSGSGVGATLIKGVNNVNGIDMSGSTVLTSPTVKLFNDPNSYITKWSTPFTAIYVDSVNGSNNNDGTQNFPFATLKRAIALAPKGSSCKILLKGDQTHTITSDIDITDKRLWVDTYGAYTNKPIITPNGFVNGTTRNEWYGFAGNGEVNFNNIEIQTGFFADNTKSLDTDKSGLLKSSSLFEIGKSTLTNCIVKIQDNAILGTGLTPSGISYLALWNCTVTTTGSGYVISNDDFSLVGLKVGVVTTIDNAARWVKNIKRAADNSPLNILSNITL